MSRTEPSGPAFPGLYVGEEESLSRGEVLFKGALAAGALLGLHAVTPYVRGALAASEEKDDVDILNFLLSFEYLQASIYDRGNSEINDKNEKMPLKKPEKELIETLLGEENEHVSAVKEMIEELGGTPADRGEYAFAFRQYETLLYLSSVIEDAAIGAYNGAIPSLESDEARELAFSIVQVEGRHAAMLLTAMEEEPAPEPFDLGQSESNSLNSVVQFTGIPGIPEPLAE